MTWKAALGSGPREETLLERIPPRIAIRKNADVEMPHVLVLMDDKEKQVIEPLYQRKDRFPKLYDFELMQNGRPDRRIFCG